VSDLADLNARVKAIETVEVPALSAEIIHNFKKLDCIASYNFYISKEQFEIAWRVGEYPHLIKETMEDTKLQIEMDNAKFQQVLQD
jgi:hypothetical protein